MFYDKHVAPAFQRVGIAAPDKRDWLMESVNPVNQPAATNLASGARERIQKVALGGAKITYEAFKAGYGAADIFKHPDMGINDVLVNSKKNQEVYTRASEKADASLAGKALRSVNDQIKTTDFWLRTHPRNSFLASASHWTGDQLVQLPIWEALGATKVGAPGINNLAPRLAETPVGRFTARRLTDAFNGFMGNMVTSGGTATKKENVESGAAFAAFGALGEGLGSAADWLLKLRGKPSATTTGSSTGGPNPPGSGRPAPLEGEYMPMDKDLVTTREPINTASDSAIKKWSAENHAMGGQPMVEDMIHSGFAQLTATSESLHPVPHNDPLMGQMHTGEQMALQSLALRHYGMPMQDLPLEFQQHILQRRLELMHEGASEMPAHVPDLNYKETSDNIQKFVATASSDTKQAMEYLHSKGVDVAKVVSDNQIRTIKEQTGIKSEYSATKNASRVSAKPQKSAKVSYEDYANIQKDTAAYYKNPAKGRRAFDGTLVGARDKRAWNERLKSDNFDNFIEDLKQADGNHISFEKPFDRLLFHYAIRDKVPSAIRDKTLRMLKYKMPGKNAEEFGKMADRLSLHLLQLAQTGRLSKEQNVFKSTKTVGAPTQWQFELNTEIDKKELQMLLKIVDQHPGGKAAMKGMVQIFQANRRMSLESDPEQWLMYNKVIQNLITGVIQ